MLSWLSAGVGVTVDGIRQGEFLARPLIFRLLYGDGWHPLTTNNKNKESSDESYKR